MRVSLLSSGSGGNCVFVEGAGVRVLVDAGLPLRETRERMSAVGLDLADVSELLLTHEHSDHCAGAGVLGRKLGLTIRGTAGTLSALPDGPPAELLRPLRAGVPLRLGSDEPRDAGPLPFAASLWATPLALSHDAAEPVAYLFEERTALGLVRAAVVTDLGFAPPEVSEALFDLDAVVLEFNHDLQLLLDGPYPPALKARIRSRVGHLSNAQSAALLVGLAHNGLRHVALAHLSAHNNTPDHARRAAEGALERAECGAKLTIGEQARALSPMELEPRTAAGMSTRPPKQAQLVLL